MCANGDAPGPKRIPLRVPVALALPLRSGRSDAAGKQSGVTTILYTNQLCYWGDPTSIGLIGDAIHWLLEPLLSSIVCSYQQLVAWKLGSIRFQDVFAPTPQAVCTLIVLRFCCNPVAWTLNVIRFCYNRVVALTLNLIRFDTTEWLLEHWT